MDFISVQTLLQYLKLHIFDMNADDICVNIKRNEILDFSDNRFNNSRIIAFVDSWSPPFIYDTNTSVCGPLAKIAEQLSKLYGYRY